jgi:ABC-type multidrug transport system fused ATPase/permease subunit
MKISKNETVALVGESGCGKSTTVALILRFYDVTEGKILVDGVDVREWDIISLRKAMGLVMQEPTLFNYTISENILYGKLDANNSQIRGATHIANAAEFIESDAIENAFDDSANALLKELQRNQAYLEHKYGPDKLKEIKDDLEKL